MIQRNTPDIGYLQQEVFDAFAFSQCVRAGGVVYFAGIAPLQGGLADLKLIGENDMAAQVQFVLDVLDRCLQSEGLGREHLATWTFYTTDINGLSAVLPGVLGPWVGEHRPSSTTVEVRTLLHPAQWIEITATAVVPPGH